MKYVILDEFMPVLFSSAILHSRMNNLDDNCRVTSAGFVKVVRTSEGFEVTCYGESQSLGLGPGPNDADLIRQLLETVT